ncbi:josephin-like protein [Phragmites australis]|uniref:josephin-like protein n=1 Tax=Phragmites australis TaxID=29695 RepID=UPI002D782F2C|nr:josephin-like protein [Phragmites australis]
MEPGAKSEAKQEEQGSGAVGSGGGGNSKVYHERQRLQFCLLHALNNLMQEKECFTRAELDGVARNLVLSDPNKDHWSPLSFIFKPHHNVVTGNYDVNVLIAALEARKKKVVWHDHRKEASSIDLDAESFIGLMINVPVRRFRGLWTGRHWVAIRSIDGIWFNLDSDLSEPKQFKDKENVIVFLDSLLSQGGELMIVLQDE